MSATGFDEPGSGALLVRGLVREVVASQAPEELPLVDRLWMLDDVHVVCSLRRQRRRGDLLGYGAGVHTGSGVRRAAGSRGRRHPLCAQ